MEKYNPAELISGKYTFWGCFKAYRNQIAADKGWNENTLKGYESSIRNIIIPHIRGHDQKAIGFLTREDFEVTLSLIRKKGYISEAGNVCRYDAETLERFWYLIRVITEAAEKNYICADILANKEDATGTERYQKKDNKKIVPRYMSREMEQKVGEILLTNPMQEGAFMGLAGMFCWGGRNAEAAGLNFGNIKLWQDIPGCWIVWVYKTTKIDSNRLQSAGKTKNADRVVLLPDRYVQLILSRKQRLQKILGPDVNVDELPVACRGNDYHTRCSADDLTAAAKRLFKIIQLPLEQIEQAHDDVLAALAAEEDALNRMNADQIEKEPTAYFLRRVYGTSLACVGLSERDIAFQIGHDLGTTPEYRNEMLNTAKLLAIKKKLDMRPVVNGLNQINAVVDLPVNGATAITSDSKVMHRSPAGIQRIDLHLKAKEPLDNIRITLSTEGEQRVHMSSVSYSLQTDTYTKELNVVADYHRLYKNTSKEEIKNEM